MDRNQAIGLVLITVIMMGYFMYFGTQQQEAPKTTTEATTPATQKIIETPVDSIKVDSATITKKFGGFSALASGQAKQDTLGNEKIKITFNSKGGAIENVLLKKYLTSDQKPLYVVDKNSNKMDFLVSTTSGQINLADLYFTPTRNDTSVTYKAEVGPGQYIEQIYSLPKNSYVVNYKLKFVGLDNLISNKPVEFNWKANLPQLERDFESNRTNSTVNYYMADGEFDYLNEREVEEQSQKLEAPVKWISMKQRFFSSAIIAQNSFENGFVKSQSVDHDKEANTVTLNTNTVKYLSASVNIPIGDIKSDKGNFQFYFGPNQYDILKGVTDGFDKNVFLGWPVINWINRFIVIPVFHFLESFMGNYGIIIIILVILIKLLLFPLSYKSYVAMAKMKVLKPEIDEIKERHEGDMQKSQMETMDLYRKVGINPLSGCIPILLQMPILLAMFNFFPNSIELRQENFLWANDLSTFDAVFTWDTYIWGLSDFYGNHFSLFTFLMTISTIVYTWFNNQVSTVTGPMKTVSYVMPVVFMFVLNSFPAGLSFYYFVSNIVTIIQQVVIRKFVDEDKIRATLEENRKRNATNPGKKSRWMNRIEEAMKLKEEEMKKKKKK